MTTIHKYILEMTDEQVIALPMEARILSIQEQKNHLCLWAMVDPELGKTSHIIEIFGTGQAMGGADRSYLGTVKMNDGSFVWHVFERMGP